jgi:hypothetical protein
MFTSHSHNEILELKNLETFSPTSSIVVIPHFVDERGVTFIFGIQNDFANAVVIENLEVSMRLPRSATLAVGPEWREMLTDGNSARQFITKPLQALLPGDNELLPYVSLATSRTPEFGNRMPIRLIIRAKDVPSTGFSFWVETMMVPKDASNTVSLQIVSFSNAIPLPNGDLGIPLSSDK